MSIQVKDMVFTELQRASLSFLGNEKLKIIELLMKYLLRKNLITKVQVIIFFKNCYTLSFIRDADFIQVGGNFCYSFIVSSLSLFHDTFYLGSLSESDQGIFLKLNKMLIKLKLKEVKIVEHFVETTSKKIVSIVKISDQSFEMSDWQHAIIFLSEKSATTLNCQHLLAKGVSFEVGKKVYWKFPIDLAHHCPHLESLLLLDNGQITFLEIVGRLLADNFVFTKDQFDNLKNELHLAYQNHNPVTILTNFCLLMLQFILKTNNHSANKQCIKDFILMTRKSSGFSRCLFLILYRQEISSFALTLFVNAIESIPSPNLEIILCLQQLHALTIRRVKSEIREQIMTSYQALMANNLNAKLALEILDNAVHQDDEELNILSNLIPEFVILHHQDFSFAGKTLLGGMISISIELYPRTDAYSDTGKFILVLRHEISHKKWLLLGSGNRFSINSPLISNSNIREAGYLLDMQIYGTFRPNSMVSVRGMSEETGLKIRNADKLSEEELAKHFVVEEVKKEEE